MNNKKENRYTSNFVCHVRVHQVICDWHITSLRRKKNPDYVEVGIGTDLGREWWLQTGAWLMFRLKFKSLFRWEIFRFLLSCRWCRVGGWSSRSVPLLDPEDSRIPIIVRSLTQDGTLFETFQFRRLVSPQHAAVRSHLQHRTRSVISSMHWECWVPRSSRSTRSWQKLQDSLEARERRRRDEVSSKRSMECRHSHEHSRDQGGPLREDVGGVRRLRRSKARRVEARTLSGQSDIVGVVHRASDRDGVTDRRTRTSVPSGEDISYI